MNLHRQVGEPIEVNISIETANFKDNAYDIYKEARLHEPVRLIYHGEFGKEWLITRYQDAVHLLKDPRLTKDPANVYSKDNMPKLFQGKSAEYLTTFMFQKDGAEHKYLRSFTQKPFRFDMVSKLEGNIKQISQELLESIQEKNTFNLVKEYTELIPIYTISDMLGVPKKDRKQFKVWIDFLLEQSQIDEENISKETELVNFLTYLKNLIDLKTKNPSEDLITHLIFTEKKGKHLRPKELYSMITLLIATGYKPTSYLITNTMLALLEHPDQFEKLKQEKSLIDSTIEESLRYYSPGEVTTARWALEPFDLHGKSIQIGDKIAISLASANRDETVFENPEKFDITREDNKHIAFAPGPHACIGSHLAKLEAKIAIANLINHYPKMKINGSRKDIKWQANYALRYIDEIPITLENNTNANRK